MISGEHANWTMGIAGFLDPTDGTNTLQARAAAAASRGGHAVLPLWRLYRCGCAELTRSRNLAASCPDHGGACYGMTRHRPSDARIVGAAR